MSSSEALVALATVVRPQGRHGEVLCDLLTDFPTQFTEANSLQLVMPAGGTRPVTVENFWLPTGRNAGRVVLKLTGVNSISDADVLRGASVVLPRAQRAELDGQTYYVADLVGCDLYDGDRLLGKVTDVQFPVDSTGKRLLDAPALFAVERDTGDSLLVPFANAFVQSIDVEQRLIRMKLPVGLEGLDAG